MKTIFTIVIFCWSLFEVAIFPLCDGCDFVIYFNLVILIMAMTLLYKFINERTFNITNRKYFLALIVLIIAIKYIYILNEPPPPPLNIKIPIDTK